jgi:phage-related protein/flagellar biosynthesis GTPase FlhF
MADVLAEAVVELEADVDKFNKEFKKSMKQAEAEAKASADDIDKSFKQLTGNLGKEFEQATREAARQFREQEREAARVAREVERETNRVQREIEREATRVQREIQKEVRETARANERAQKEYEREFIASQQAMEAAVRVAQERQAEHVRSALTRLRRLGQGGFSLTLGIDSSQVTSALAGVTKLGALLGVLGTGALAGQASLAGVAQLVLAVQELVGAIALLPAAGAAAGIVITTLTLGLRGLGEAIAEDSPAKLAESMKKFSENGKSFVNTVREFKDEFEDMRKAVQQVLLAEFNAEVRQLAQKLLPVLQTGFVVVARELNLAARALAKFVYEKQTLVDVDRIFFNTAQAVQVFRGAIRPAAQAMRDLAAVGSDFLPIIAAEVGTAAAKFGEFVKQARASGALREFFVNALDAVKDFFAILGNLGSAFNAVTRAANQALGGGFLDLLRSATQQLENLLESADGQTALITFFEGAREAAKAILPILGDFAKLVLEVVLPALTKLGVIAAPAVDALVGGLRNGLERALPGIFAFVDALADVVTTLVDLGVLEALGDLVRVVGTSLGDAIRNIAPQLGRLVGSVLTKLADILPKIIPPLGDFAGAFLDLVDAAVPLLDVLAGILSDVGLPTLQRIAQQLTPIMSDLAQSLGETLLPILPDLGDAFRDLVDALAPIVDDVLKALVDLIKIVVPLLPSFVRGIAELAVAVRPLTKLFSDVIQSISNFVTKLYEIPGVRQFMQEQLPGLLALLMGTIIVPLGKIIELLDEFFTFLEDSGAFDIFFNSITLMADGLKGAGDAFGRLSTAIGNAFSAIRSAAESGINFLIELFKSGMAILGSIFSVGWETVKTIFSIAWNFLLAIASAVLRSLLAIVTGNFSAIPGIVGDALRRMGDAARDAFNNLLNLISSLPGQIRSALGNLGGLLYGAGQDLVQGMINGVKSMIGSLASQAANMASSALKAAKAALDSKSPSRKMIAVGEDFGSGFVIGIENMVRQASRVGAELAAQTAQSSSSALVSEDNSTYRTNESLNRLTRNGFGPPPTPMTTTGEIEPAPVVVSPEVHVYIGNEEIDSHITDVVDERDRRVKRSVTMGARRTV